MAAARPTLDLTRYSETIRKTDTISADGRVTQVIGVLVESCGPACGVGEICKLHCQRTGRPVLAEVVGFRESRTLLMPFGAVSEIRPGSEVVATGSSLRVPVGPGLLGRVLDGLGRPLDGKGSIEPEVEVPTSAPPPHPLARRRIRDALALGIRAIDGLMTVGKGQRLGIFSGSGVGKSTLLGMIARNTSADVNVIGLVGERGREVRDFIEKDLGEEGLKKAVVVVATSDEPPLVRVQAGAVATAVAEHFRDAGCDVLLLMDSLTRLALAQRQIGLVAGEPPATKGYTPSVFNLLPELLERSGRTASGSITGFYTVLVEGDDMSEPIADAVRSITDGHVWLSRSLANRGQYPAIDVLDSVSRVMIDVVDAEHRQAAQQVQKVLAVYRDIEDLVNIGAYVNGANAECDLAVKSQPLVNEFLRQDITQRCAFGEARTALLALGRRIRQAPGRPGGAQGSAAG